VQYSINVPSPGITTIVSIDPALIVDGNGNLNIDEAKLQVKSSAAVSEMYVSGETISALKAVYLHEGAVYVAGTGSLAQASALGIAQNAGTAGQAISVLQYGVLTDASFNFSPSQLIFLSETGSLTTTAPSSGLLTRIGRAIGPTSVLILIESPINL
jgi:hypothetical protein